LIDATMGEKNRLLRSFLMKVCRGTTTLAEVQANVEQARRRAARFDESIYTEIAGYLELVVPQLAELPPSRRLALGDGLSVIDLTAYRPEVQGLVIRSVLEHVYEHETDVVTVIPEAWQFLPEQRGSPVRLAFETLVRKGAALRELRLARFAGSRRRLETRDPRVLGRAVRRAARGERNQTVAREHAGDGRETDSGDIATLGLGEFVACWATHAVRTYVQPAGWPTRSRARSRAASSTPATRARSRPPANVGRAVAETFGQWNRNAADPHQAPKGEQDVRKTEAEALRRENDDLKRRLAALEREHRVPVAAAPPRPAAAATIETTVEDALYETIKARLIADVPWLLKVIDTKPELVVISERKEVVARGETTLGRVARLIKTGALAESKRFREILVALERTGPRVNNKSLSVALAELVAGGFLVRESVDRYAAVADMAIRIVEP
jgi:hypothetical protein